MIIVMPADHLHPFGFGYPLPALAEFTDDGMKDLRPYVESHYRTRNDRQSRAIAGLSMGGFQTLGIAIPQFDDYAYIGVFSSGLPGIVPFGGGAPAPTPATFESDNRTKMDDASLKKDLKLFWFATGTQDSLMPTTRATIDLFKKHGFTPEFHESEGGHTWLNWRDYLIFAPRLFQ